MFDNNTITYIKIEVIFDKYKLIYFYLGVIVLGNNILVCGSIKHITVPPPISSYTQHTQRSYVPLPQTKYRTKFDIISLYCA